MSFVVQYDFDDPSWDEVSEEAKHLIRHLLVKNTEERYTAEVRRCRMLCARVCACVRVSRLTAHCL